MHVFSEGAHLLTINVSDFVQYSDQTIFLNVTFNHQMLTDKVHLRHILSYRIKKTLFTVVLTERNDKDCKHYFCQTELDQYQERQSKKRLAVLG